MGMPMSPHHSWKVVTFIRVEYSFFVCVCVPYLFLRERERVHRGGAEREGDTESEAGSRL